MKWVGKGQKAVGTAGELEMERKELVLRSAGGLGEGTKTTAGRNKGDDAISSVWTRLRMREGDDFTLSLVA